MTTAIFLDTTIQIARFIGSRDVKAKINRRLSQFGFTVTGLVVRQEFKRRFLTDVRYVRNALRKNKFDTAETLRHINSKLGLPFNRRKLSICLDVFATAAFNGKPLTDAGEMFDLILSGWEQFGLRRFDESVGQVVQYSGCGCAKLDDTSATKCSSAKNCEIGTFISSMTENMRRILNVLSGLDHSLKSREISNAEARLTKWLGDTVTAKEDNPCLTVGDLVISMESQGIPVFYTKNARESQFLCRAQDQSMIVLREDDETVLDSRQNSSWPVF
ncbi:MAG: hypothetical protein U0996_25065 [Planctomycetaceae bacterium]